MSRTKQHGWTRRAARTALVAGGLAAGLLGAMPSTAAAATGWDLQRVSLTDADHQSQPPASGKAGIYPSIDGTGRKVAFVSESSDLVVGDTNGVADLFVRDRVAGTTVRVSVSSSGQQANGETRVGAISPDGGYVVFSSTASNLVIGDTNGQLDYFVRDLNAGVTTRVSVATGGAQGTGDAGFVLAQPALSRGGRYVTFLSGHTNLVAGDTNGKSDVFWRDRLTGTTKRVGISTAAAQGNNDATASSISDDGMVVAFESLASNLVSGDTNAASDVFVRRLTANSTERVSRDHLDGQLPQASSLGALSADGKAVAFSTRSVVTPGDGNQLSDLYVRRLDGPGLRYVSTSWIGTSSNGDTAPGPASLSADGSVVAWSSFASDLTPGEPADQLAGVYVRNLTTGAPTAWVSTPQAGAVLQQSAFWVDLSADGEQVAFMALDPNLVAGDTNGAWDAFVADSDPGRT